MLIKSIREFLLLHNKLTKLRVIFQIVVLVMDLDNFKKVNDYLDFFEVCVQNKQAKLFKCSCCLQLPINFNSITLKSSVSLQCYRSAQWLVLTNLYQGHVRVFS